MHHAITCRTITCRTIIASLGLLLAPTGLAAAQETTSPPPVKTMRVPNGGIQPQVAVDANGVVHLIYCKGDPRGCNVFYVKSTDGGETFSEPMRVNRREGSAVTAGTIRGPHLAIGRHGRAHVAWNGSGRVTPEGDHRKAPLLYTRMNDAGDGFEPERNIITARFGLDGGSSIAADDAGNVFVVWHAPMQDGRGEGDRRVWVARSTDDGVTFATERMASEAPRGACGCCGLRAFAGGDGDVNVLYRSAWDNVNRHMFLLNSGNGGDDFDETRVHDWTIGQCVVSSAAFAQTSQRLYAAWETKEQVFFASIDAGTNALARPVPAPGRGDNRKQPALAANDRGHVILVWTEGTRWKKGGFVGWQVFDAAGDALLPENGRAEGLPVWGLPAVFARPDGGFVVVY